MNESSKSVFTQLQLWSSILSGYHTATCSPLSKINIYIYMIVWSLIHSVYKCIICCLRAGTVWLWLNGAKRKALGKVRCFCSLAFTFKWTIKLLVLKHYWNTRGCRLFISSDWITGSRAKLHITVSAAKQHANTPAGPVLHKPDPQPPILLRCLLFGTQSYGTFFVNQKTSSLPKATNPFALTRISDL